MRIELLDCHANADYIRTVRREILRELSLPDRPGLVEPLPHAIYLAMYQAAGGPPVGMAEACFLDQMFPRLEAYGPAKTLNFAALGRFEQMSLIRSIYVDPGWRIRRHVYADLYLAMSHIFRGLGATVALMATSDQRGDLLDLYRKTGGRSLGSAPVPSAPDAPVAWNMFDLSKLLTSRRAMRAIASINCDLDRVARIRTLKAYD